MSTNWKGFMSEIQFEGHKLVMATCMQDKEHGFLIGGYGKLFIYKAS